MTKTDFIDRAHNRAIELSDKDKKVYVHLRFPELIEI